jgi:hypothetical protein
MLVTCIHSLRKVCPDAGIILTTDGIPQYVGDLLYDEYDVEFDIVGKQRMVGRRATCKVERLCKCVEEDCEDGDIVLASDVDVVFLKDPFTAMEDEDIDIGLTTRGYPHLFPINGGIFYMRMNNGVQDWLLWHVEQIHNPTWKPYVDHREKCNHQRYGLDWSVGQDFLVACWMFRHHVWDRFKIRVSDVGPNYNFCPPTDTMGDGAFDMVWKALEEGEITTLHLKSALKGMIYDRSFPDAQILYPKGNLAWL